MSTYETLLFIQGGRRTRRYHGLLMHDYQRVDAHSYGVTMLTQVLVPPSDPMRAAQLMGAALLHDLAEHISGDIPAPTKRALNIRDICGQHEDALLAKAGLRMPLLDERDQRVLKLADAAEGCLHCIEERKLGNLTIARDAFYKFWSYCTEEQLLCNHPKWSEEGEPLLADFIQYEWTKYNGEW